MGELHLVETIHSIAPMSQDSCPGSFIVTRWNLVEKLPFLLLSTAFLYSQFFWRTLCLGNSFLSNPIIHCLWNDETAGKISLFLYLSFPFLFLSFLLSFIFFILFSERELILRAKRILIERAVTISRVSYLPLDLRNKYCYREVHGGQTEGSLGSPVTTLQNVLIYAGENSDLKAKYPVSSWLADKKGLCSW